MLDRANSTSPEQDQVPDRPPTTEPAYLAVTPERRAEHVETLASQAARGCHDALGELYDLTVGPLYRYLFRHTCSHHTAEDLTSETWMAALGAIDRYRYHKGHGFTAWLFTIARNKLISYHRSRYALSVAPRPPEEMIDIRSNLDGSPLCGHSRRCIADAIGHLRPAQREAVVLKDIIGLTLEEAAAVRGKKPAAVRRAHARAKTALRATLAECWEAHEHA